MRRAAAAVALATLAACGGSPPRPAASPTASPSATKKPKPKPKPSATATPTLTPTVTTPPPPSGDPMTAAGAFLTFVQPGEPRRVAEPLNCAAVFPDLGSPRCGIVKMDAGNLLWGSGTAGDRKAVRLLTQDASGGYVLRYEGVQGGGPAWGDPAVVVAPVIGKAPDGVGVLVPLAGGAGTYDVLTWVKGGPLVLRAHRSALPEGRLGPVDGAFAEYLRQADGAWVMRRVAWDGTRFLLSSGVRVPERSVPPR